jgi:hypothetical protein
MFFKQISNNKTIPRTFRNVENLDFPLAEDCPKFGSH